MLKQVHLYLHSLHKPFSCVQEQLNLFNCLFADKSSHEIVLQKITSTKFSKQKQRFDLYEYKYIIYSFWKLS